MDRRIRSLGKKDLVTIISYYSNPKMVVTKFHSKKVWESWIFNHQQKT